MPKYNEQKTVDFFQTGLCFQCHLIKNELIDFDHYNREIELAWTSRSRDVEDELAAFMGSHPEVEAHEIAESYAWDLHINQMKFPNIHRESMTLSLYSFLEYELNCLCKILLVSLDSPLSLKDIAGSGVERAILCLKKVVGFDFELMSSELGDIRSINLIRNHIVHNGGVLPSDKGHKIHKYIARCEYISGEPDSPLQLESCFVSFFIDVLFRFFGELDKEIQKFIQMRIVDE